MNTPTESATTTATEGSVFLPGILNETDEVNDDGSHEGGDSDSDSSISNDGSNYDVTNSVFDADNETDELDYSPSDDPGEGEKETMFMSDEWDWNNWDDIGDEEEIRGPPENDRYNGPHGLKPGVINRFKTVLQCLMTTTALSLDFFDRLTTQSNKFARNQMKERCSNKFIGRNWQNIRVEEMIRFFGIMLRISLEPRKMGGYPSYFTDQSSLGIGTNYSVHLRGYKPWAKDVMTLVRFKQIRSAFHPES